MYIRVAVSVALSCSSSQYRVFIFIVLFARFLSHYRAENLRYQSSHGQKLLPQFRKIVGLVFGLGGTPTPEQKLIRSVLINGMCDFEDGIGAARRRPHRTPSLTISTSDCAVLLRSRRTKRGGIMSERHFSMRVLSVVPRYAGTVGSLVRGNGDRGNS